jgi:hypothetical protein
MALDGLIQGFSAQSAAKNGQDRRAGFKSGDQFGLCFETPLRLILKEPSEARRLEGEAQGLLSMRPN